MVCTCAEFPHMQNDIYQISQVFVLGVNFAETKLVKVRSLRNVYDAERGS